MGLLLAFSLVLSVLTPSLGFSKSRQDVFIGYAEVTQPRRQAGGRVALTTAQGKIQILLMRKNAPHTTDFVSSLAARQEACTTCRFYRNEARSQPGDLGPPYGLLQGSLAELEGLPPREGNLVTRRGHVCMIPGTKEFFIALSDHSEWGTAHTVWGEVEDMEAVEAIVSAPFHEVTHPDYGTRMRMLDEEVPFRIDRSPAAAVEQLS